MPSNKAAYIESDKAKPLSIKDAPYPSPGANDIVIKNGALAINPVDWAIQEMGKDLIESLYYPLIVGTDVAGEVVEVGNSVSNFRVGDRVLAMCPGVEEGTPRGAFQLYTLVQHNLAAHIPKTMSYEHAAVIPLGMSTAACAMFEKSDLALQRPTVPPKPTGKTLLVWGGASSVGSNAIQLGVGAGYEVITTASPKNFEFVKKLGASKVFDYRSETVVDDIVAALEGREYAGAFAASGQAANEPCVAVTARANGKKYVALANPPVPENLPPGVQAKFAWGSSFRHNDLAAAVFHDFLAKALEEGSYVAAPEPEVVGKGLESLQHALEVQKQGVSAKKIVVSLSDA